MLSFFFPIFFFDIVFKFSMLIHNKYRINVFMMLNVYRFIELKHEIFFKKKRISDHKQIFYTIF